MTPEKAAHKVLSAQISQMQDLQRMASEPWIFSLMCQIVDEARVSEAPTAIARRKALATLATDKLSPRLDEPDGGLTVSVLEACQSIGQGITVAKVVELMHVNGYKFSAASPKIAVSDVIRRYTDKRLKMTTKGHGNQPHVYRWISDDIPGSGEGKSGMLEIP